MKTTKSDAKILNVLLKDFTIKSTVTSLAKEISMSRVGAWKVLKKMQSDKLINLSPVGSGKTSTYNISLNWDNPLVEKTLALSLTEDALKNQRWLSNFAELRGKVDFLIIYGSIIHSPKEANDIDILCLVSNKNKFLEIEESIKKIQKTQLKNIHALSFTQAEFRQELEKPNKVFIDAIKKGIILFGQENFIKFVKSISRK
jgi:DNA-binding Lrp family transcriptional regulator